MRSFIFAIVMFITLCFAVGEKKYYSIFSKESFVEPFDNITTTNIAREVVPKNETSPEIPPLKSNFLQ